MTQARLRPLTEVAVAIILRSDGKFLLAQRPPGKAYAGYWEFPGGKVEAQESMHDALLREIREELGLHVTLAYPWLTQTFDYPHARVNLHFYRVLAWQGEPHPHEGQVLSWESSAGLSVSPMLPANGPILRALSLPSVMGISHASVIGEQAFLQELDKGVRAGLRLLQIREPLFDEAQLRAFIETLRREKAGQALRLMVNAAPEIVAKIADVGLHLNARRLCQLQTRPDFAWCGASCHNAAELAQAAELGLDYVLLGPTLATPSHPGAPSLGWETVGALIRDYPLPVYCIGGMQISDLKQAWQQGAHGIAMLRGIGTCV